MPPHIIFPSLSSNPHGPLLILAVFTATLLIFTWIRLRQMPDGERPALDRPAIYAYRSARRYGVQTFTDNESVAHANMSIRVYAPREQGSYPLIVYLPDHGGSVGGERQLEKSWAAAGYAVVALSRIRPSAQRCDEASAHIRNDLVLMIRQLLAELERRDMPPFDCIDFNEIAFAGCGSGAHAALALADSFGEGIDMASRKVSLQTGAAGMSANESPATPLRCRYPGIFALQLGGKQHGLVLSAHPLNDQASGNSLSIPEIANARAIEHFSLAFLDAILKDDPVAVEWLEHDAERLLESLGVRHRSWHSIKNENHAAITGFRG